MSTNRHGMVEKIVIANRGKIARRFCAYRADMADRRLPGHDRPPLNEAAE